MLHTQKKFTIFFKIVELTNFYILPIDSPHKKWHMLYTFADNMPLLVYLQCKFTLQI